MNIGSLGSVGLLGVRLWRANRWALFIAILTYQAWFGSTILGSEDDMVKLPQEVSCTIYHADKKLSLSSKESKQIREFVDFIVNAKMQQEVKRDKGKGLKPEPDVAIYIY